MMDPNDRKSIIRRAPAAQLLEAAPSLPIGWGEEQEGFGWEQSVRVLRKNRRFAISFVLFITLLGVGAAVFMKNSYEPTARVWVDPETAGISPLQEIQNFHSESDLNYLETQSQILQSDALALRVIRSLQLDRDPRFVGKKALEKYGVPSKVGLTPEAGLDQDVTEFQEAVALADRTPLESIALKTFHRDLTVTTIRNSRLLEITFNAHYPDIAQDATNRLVREYVDWNFRVRNATSLQASSWISGQLKELRQRVQDSNEAVTDFQRKYNIVDMDEREIPSAGLVNELNHQLSDSQAGRIEAESYVRMIDDGQADSVPALRDDQLYQNLMEQFVAIRGQLAQARAVYGDASANVKKLQNQSDELGAQVAAERSRMIDQIRNTYEAARSREDMMVKARQSLLAQLGHSTSHMTEYKVLRNDAIASADLYNLLLGRVKETGIYAGLRPANIHIVDLAPLLQKPTGPPRALIIAICAVVGGMLAVILAFVKESLNNTVRTPDDVKDWVGLPSLAIVPSPGTATRNGASPQVLFAQPAESRLDAQLPKILLTRPFSPEAEAIHDLRTALLLQHSGPAPHVILVTSPSAGEGKTTVASNLAMVLAQKGRTCLVDADLRQPMVAQAFRIKNEKGLSQVVRGGISLDAALTDAPNAPNLSLLTSGPVPPDPADLLASVEMAKTVQSLRDRFEYVVVDCSPVIRFSDPRVLSSLVDVVILVGRYGLTTRIAITRCAQLLNEVRAPILGVVVNGISVDSPDFQYYNYGFGRADYGGKYAYPPKTTTPPPAPPAPSNGGGRVRGAHA